MTKPSLKSVLSNRVFCSNSEYSNQRRGSQTVLLILYYTVKYSGTRYFKNINNQIRASKSHETIPLTLLCGYYRMYQYQCCRAASFYAAPGKNFDAAPAAPAPTLLCSKAKFLKGTKVQTHVETIFFIWFCTIYEYIYCLIYELNGLWTVSFWVIFQF
jgi:hypothetical protein